MSQHDQQARPIPPDPRAPRFGGRPAWSEAEREVIRQHYPRGGAVACAPLLPGRTLGGIGSMARQIGARFHRHYQKQADSHEVLDAAIRNLYSRAPFQRGALAAFELRWGRPRQWVRGRAIQLGVVRARGQGRRWRDDEDRLLLDCRDYTPRTIQKRLAERLGVRDRTEAAIAERLRLLRRRHDMREAPDPDVMTIHALSALMGVSDRTVARWIQRGLLRATVERDLTGVPTRYSILRKDLREFLITSPAEWHPGNCDRFWLVEMLAGRVGAKR